MDFIFSGTFWGIILILFGVSMIFGIHIPIFRIIIALAIITFGIKLLTGKTFSWQSIPPNAIIFGKGSFDPLKTPEQTEYSVIFAEGELNLTRLALASNKKHVLKFNTIFGSGKIIVSKNTAVQIKMSAAFGNAILPGAGRVEFFGTNNWSNPHAKPDHVHNKDQALIEIEANAVFGQIEVVLLDR